MRKRIVSAVMLLFIGSTVMSQSIANVSGNCFKEDSCFASSQIYKTDYIFSTVKNTYLSARGKVDLYMTVYSAAPLPKNIQKKTIFANGKYKQPFILLIHGGGFRAGCRTLIANECMEFAKRGYVVAAIDYRLGWAPGDDKKYCKGFCFDGACGLVLNSPCRVGLSDSLDFAVYRSIQDADAAMRYIAHYADNFNIDKRYLYVGGYSAGAITAVNLSYMNQKDLNAVIPKAKAKLGLYNTYGNSFTDKYKIAGLFNNWGGIKDTAYIKATGDKVPMIAFHGIDDSIVPLEKDYPFNCINGAYGSFTGSKLIYERLIHKFPGIPVELYVTYGKHGIFDENPSTDRKALYRIQKAVCFFNRVRNGDKTQKFIEIDKNEDDITYDELIKASPVECDAGGLQQKQYVPIALN
ncbi:carboxylesterase family protein [Parafilimonas terrae]|uniref:Acetyl esterase/lipase n=1 Tax=Parafilimonas terrae TaxID=1465490 RepID=A0A1I5ZEM2_9BACT|nr:carboxylesterase family protein [Parafilimonas terrae]SFQ54890.1 Acetyl esterase/lipase [Parafilimonas terrae]